MFFRKEFLLYIMEINNISIEVEIQDIGKLFGKVNIKL
jgi:hypothetical protein